MCVIIALSMVLLTMIFLHSLQSYLVSTVFNHLLYLVTLFYYAEKPGLFDLCLPSTQFSACSLWEASLEDSGAQGTCGHTPVHSYTVTDT